MKHLYEIRLYKGAPSTPMRFMHGELHTSLAGVLDVVSDMRAQVAQRSALNLPSRSELRSVLKARGYLSLELPASDGDRVVVEIATRALYTRSVPPRPGEPWRPLLDPDLSSDEAGQPAPAPS